MLKQFFYRVLTRLVPICFNFLNLLLGGNLPPQGCVSVVVEDGGRFLLLRRPNSETVFPGGFIRWREFPAETAKREFREETGLELKLLDTLGVYANKSAHIGRMSTLTIGFVGTVVGGAMHSSIEGSPYWADEDEIRRSMREHYSQMLVDYFAYRGRKRG